LHSLPRFLPPIGVFWDIENCQVPKGRSAVAVAQVIRDRFFSGYREAEFLVVCDVKKESSQVIQELNDAQVNLIHVASTCKNAADEKLRQTIRRFADIHGSPAAIILISGDINFAADLNDLRHRKKFHVILLHNSSASEALIMCASEHYNFPALMEDLPLRGSLKSNNQPMEIVVSNLPEDKDQARIKNRLKQLSGNCGGRVVAITKSTATIRFSTGEFATRAQKRMDGEDVFGRKITVGYPHKVLERDKKEGSPMKAQSVRKQKGNFRDEDGNQQFVHTAIGSTSYQKSASLSSVYNSTPAGLNVLSSIPVSDFMSRSSQNGWNILANGNTAATTLPSEFCYPVQNQENFWYGSAAFKSTSAECIDSSLNRKENSRIHSPLAAGAWQGLKETAAKEELKQSAASVKHETKSRIMTVNGNSEKTPEGYRRIRGIHRVCVSDENSSVQQHQEQHTAIHSHQPFAAFNTFMSCSGGPYSRHQAAILSNGAAAGRKCRTPSPYSLSGPDKEGSARRGWPIVLPAHITACSDTEREEAEHYFHPISSSKLGANGSLSSSVPCNNPVVLQVTNLDQNIDAKELKRILLTVFREHVMVLHVSVFVQSDGNYAAHVKVPSLQDAQYAISQLHRRKVGYKRILISYANSGGPSPQLIRSQIISLLLEVPGHCLPLFKFRELFESRYLTSISISDMHKMKDVCLISEDSTGRMVILNPDHRNTPSPVFPTAQDGQPMELPYCILHSRKPGSDKGWAEQKMGVLPNVRIGLNAFAVRIHMVLQTHNGSLPLPSLPHCYEAQFETLAVDDTGVPLEHLVSCLPGIDIYQGVGCVKYLRWLKSKGNDDALLDDPLKCVSPPLATQLALFSRELVDLLKTSPHCQLPFSRFIPAYHHHFGRQCRVADYGFTKLIDLMEALPHIVQVMGEGNKRVITLSHRAQVRRFTSDLLRVLKSQASKQVTLSEFPAVYQRVLNRPWDIVDYGLCEFRDMMGQVSENTVVVTTQEDGDLIISIPKREQTPEEIEKTKQFAGEVVELLRHAPECSMMFNKFIPAYHHHYGHQCRVADYGFTKLIELFEAIPHVAKVEEDGEGERKVTLTLEERLKVLAEQISALIHSRRSCMSLSALSLAFLRQHGYALKPEAYECSSLEQLIQHLHHSVAIIPSPSGPVVMLVDRTGLHQLSLQVRRILMEQPSGKMSAGEFLRTFWNYFNQTLNLDQIQKQLAGVIQVTKHSGDTVVELTPIQMFACNVYHLLFESGGRLPLSAFESAYLCMFGTPCQPAQFGQFSIISLLQSIPGTVLLRGRANKKRLVLNKDLASVGIPLPADLNKQGLQTDENDPEIHPLETSRHLPPVGGADGTLMTESQKQLPEVENLADKFLKSILGSDLFDSPSSSKSDSQGKALSEKVCSPNQRPSTWGPMWGGASPPQYAPYCHSAAFSAYMGGSVPPWPKATLTTSSIMSPTKMLLSSHSSPLSVNSPPSYHFPSGCLPHVVPPDPSELPLPQLIGSRPGTRASEGPEDDQWCSKTSGDADKDLDHKSGRTMSTAGDSLDSSNVSIEMAESGLNTPNRTRRKRRLAAQFNTPIEMP